mmetsp:Transcript_8225/g.25799  ORF Transcript_8225/g.25799 Transcript_8225/m.25799 type:complete len:123 (-) Transcript_8225:519-887(-)
MALPQRAADAAKNNDVDYVSGRLAAGGDINALVDREGKEWRRTLLFHACLADEIDNLAPGVLAFLVEPGGPHPSKVYRLCGSRRRKRYDSTSPRGRRGRFLRRRGRMDCSARRRGATRCQAR